MPTKGLFYDDVWLTPRRISTLSSRSEADTSVVFCGQRINFPVIAAPMPDVCDIDMAHELSELGGFGIVHRFQSIEEQAIEVQPFFHYGAAIGVTDDYLERYEELYKVGCRIFCIDVANGFSILTTKCFNEIKNRHSDIRVIAGNVASKEGFQYLAELGVDAVRCGIAGGSVCTSRNETGILSPMWTTLEEIRAYKNKSTTKCLIIADGSIKEPQHLAKALCLADIAMAGGIFAGTEEAPGHVIKMKHGEMVKLFRGAASFSTQKHKAKKEPKYVEGLETFVPYVGSLKKVVDRYTGGLQSSMSYMNATNLWELRHNFDYTIVK